MKAVLAAVVAAGVFALLFAAAAWETLVGGARPTAEMEDES